MRQRNVRLAAAALSAVLFFCAATLAGDAVIEIGRPLKARDWLADLTNVPTANVPYDSVFVSNAIPARTDDYSIDPDVGVAAYSYYFHVSGKDGRFVVGSTTNLAKLVHELAVVEQLKQRSLGKEFATGVADGVKGIGTGIANLITKPGQSIKSVGKRLRQTGRSLERAVGAEEKVGRDETGKNRSHLGEGPAGQARRSLAYQFGVDVYTANPFLQKMLTDLSHAQTAGGLATWVIPYHIGTLGYFNPIAGDDATELRIRDYDPYELRRLIGEELEPILNMNREDPGHPLQRWLMNPNYSPRNTAYIGRALLQLRQAQNLHLVVDGLAQADTPEEAELLTLELRLFGLLSQNVQPIVDFGKYRAVFLGLGANNVMYIMFPGDTLRPWKETAAAFQEVLAEATNRGLAGLEIWTVGDIHPKMLDYAQSIGVTVRQQVLNDPNFYRPAPAEGSR